MSFFDTQTDAWHDIYERFKVNETANGPGSKLENTGAVREWLQHVLKTYDINSMLDAPCGDRNWIQHVDLAGVNYTGWDIEPAFIDMNRKRWPDLTFECRNLLTIKTKSLPDVDLMLMRDFVLHIPTDYVAKLLDKIKASNIRFLAVTNHPGADNYRELPDDGHDDRPGYWCRGLSLEDPPFNLTGRIDSVTESQDGTTGKCGQEMVLYRC